MKCNQLAWCERYVVSPKNPSHTGAEAGDEVETCEVVLALQQSQAVPAGDMNSETFDDDQESDPPPSDGTEGHFGDD